MLFFVINPIRLIAMVLWVALLKQTENQMPCGPIKPAGNECLLDFLPIKKKKIKSMATCGENSDIHSQTLSLYAKEQYYYI